MLQGQPSCCCYLKTVLMRSITHCPANRIAYTIIVILSIQTAIAQSVGIGTTSPDPSARLEVNSTTQGILIPKLTSTQRSAISNPAVGLLVFQSDGTQGFYYYTGTVWIHLTYGTQPNSEGIAVSSLYGFTSTLAGNGTEAYVEGTGTAASFDHPYGVTADANGNVYVADGGNNVIRKITAGGVVSTFAGSGSVDSADGIGTAASFNVPMGLAIDASGNIYVADYGNNRIRKITPGGEVSTLAGSGRIGSDDGTGKAASFYRPVGVTVDANGNVYVADQQNFKIRMITSAGVVTTLAGWGPPPDHADGTGPDAKFKHPNSVAVDPTSGNIFVADVSGHRIRKVTSAGVVTTFAGSGSPGYADGNGTAAWFSYPAGIAIDASGNIYVSEWENRKIRKITPAGMVSTLAGSGASGGADGPGTSASFAQPWGLAVDANGNVYVADTDSNKIRKIIAR
jgi:sugar lactone lactonase YvrE